MMAADVVERVSCCLLRLELFSELRKIVGQALWEKNILTWQVNEPVKQEQEIG
jgi:hypothetical protein